MSKFPDGVPAPADGSLPAQVVDGATERDFGVYVHVPYCRVRCGYCDFNTYTATELRGTRREDYAAEAQWEITFADQVMRSAGLPKRPVSTVFFGGGTPTLLPTAQLGSMLDTIVDTWGLAPDAEVSIEANPDTVTAASLRELRAHGFTRVSIGMQSTVPHVLATLDRTHDPHMVPQAVQWAKEAGLQVSVDLIYGTPGESLDDWQQSLNAAVAMAPDHISAYALIIEDGTQLARRIRRRELPAPDDDVQASMYELADNVFAAHGYHWYEISNWSTSTTTRSKHNLSYWRGSDWWAIGPGAHSHIGGVRWWNVKHPAAYAERVHLERSPAHECEVLSPEDQRIERLLLETRLAEGAPRTLLPEHAAPEIVALIGEGLLEGDAALQGRLVPTLRGRLLADTVIHRLLGA